MGNGTEQVYASASFFISDATHTNLEIASGALYQLYSRPESIHKLAHHVDEIMSADKICLQAVERIVPPNHMVCRRKDMPTIRPQRHTFTPQPDSKYAVERSECALADVPVAQINLSNWIDDNGRPCNITVYPELGKTRLVYR